MPIPCICPHCGARFTAPDKAAGRIAPCPKCKQAITIPDPRAVVPVQPLPSSQPPPQPQVVVVQAPQQPQDDFSNLQSERVRQRGSTSRMFAWMAGAPILAFSVVTASLLAVLFTCCGLPLIFVIIPAMVASSAAEQASGRTGASTRPTSTATPRR